MKRIAVVEDNPDNRLLVRVMLEERYELAEFESAAEAWVAFQQSCPDAVLLDISLPDMDGAELLRKIRADSSLRSLPVIAVTAHAMSGDREKYLALGFDDYVTKPIIDMERLVQAIDRALARNG
ncbi:MAG: response regulator [Verrucomicrobia bacterium]|nr:response regulator [Verrucomicrobiota bacterium]